MHKHETTIKAVLSLMIVLVAFGVLILFATNKDAIVMSGSFNLFMVFAVVGMGLLVALLFLSSKPHHKAVKTSKSVKAVKSKKSKKKSSRR